MQTAEDRHLEVYACELKEFIVARDIRGWYGLRGGWKLQGKKLGSVQYIRDEDGKLLRKLGEDISLSCSTRPRPPSVKKLSRAYRKSRQRCHSETRRL